MALHSTAFGGWPHWIWGGLRLWHIRPWRFGNLLQARAQRTISFANTVRCSSVCCSSVRRTTNMFAFYCWLFFDPCYKQRRRWGPSTTANIWELISNSKKAMENPSISIFYLIYHAVMMFMALIGVSTTAMMISQALEFAATGGAVFEEEVMTI